MAGEESRKRMQRLRGPGAEAKVSNVELFFDLVFVFAVTQLSHTLLKDISWHNALQVGVLFLAVWWVWIYTSWVTNWLDPDHTPVRTALFLLMLAGLVLSISIPQAFGERGLMFAAAYVAMQAGRSLFMLWALRGVNPANFRNFQRILSWSVLSGAFWLAGGLHEGETRLALWIAALVLEYCGPALGFRVPGLGRSTTAEWDIDGGHLAERCSLFIIIALGESLLVTGATFEHSLMDGPTIAAFLSAFVASAAMWWLYFDTGAARGSHSIEHADDPGRLARLAYTYLHLMIVAGIIVSAVADEMTLAHPLGAADGRSAAMIVAGPLLYVAGNGLFKRAYTGRFPLSHGVGLAILAASALIGWHWPPLALYAATTLALLVAAAWETRSLKAA
jgi:low temperature requirement protein LtrA